MKPLTLESLCAQSHYQASLYAAILLLRKNFKTFKKVNISLRKVCSCCINAEHFKNGGASLCSPVSNRLAPPKKIKTKISYKYWTFWPSGLVVQ